MALFFFGKKDKKPAEVAAPVAKPGSSPAKPTGTPPKIQTPPNPLINTGPFPLVKPPQPVGLMPATPNPAGAATTQPMSIPRTGSTGLKPPRPGTSQTRSTQRIVLPTPPGARTGGTKAATVGGPGGKINLPVGMILRCLPPEALIGDVNDFEKNGSAATEIGLPMNSILGQLPSGKVEMTLEEMVPSFPPGFLQPAEILVPLLPTVVSLPLMDVVMRIPPDLLALRPDQKDVDAAVINMADPFTEEILREQAEAARRQTGANIIDESQAPQEEFVPRDRVTKSIAPPRRPSVEPLLPARTAATTLAAPLTAPPLRPPPGTTSLPRINPILPPATTPPATAVPSLPVPSAMSSGQLPVPTRATTSLPTPSAMVQPSTLQAAVPSSTAPVPPVPRHTGPIPAPPPPRHTTSLPTVPRRTGSLASLSQRVSAKLAETPAGSPPASDSFVQAPAKPEAQPEELQRLAALAMAQLGDETPAVATEMTAAAAVAAPAITAAAQHETSTPAPEVHPEPIRAPEPAMEPAAPQPSAFENAPEPIRAPIAETPAPEPIRAPVVEAPAPEPIRAPAAETPAPVATTAVASAHAEPAAAPSGVAFNLNTCTIDDLVQNIPGCSRTLAASIVHHREKIGSFKKLDELFDVPGMTKETYTELTGEQPPVNRNAINLNDLLGFPKEMNLTLKDVTERIACWPDVTGCLLSQNTGLSLVGTAPAGLDKEAIVAFAPRMFDSLNKSFSEIAGQETDALVIPSAGTSYHLFRNGNLYLIIMARLPQMPERHIKVARFVLAALHARNT